MSTEHRSATLPDEPVGLVISYGTRSEPPALFRAYEWWPAPALEVDAAAKEKAAA